MEHVGKCLLAATACLAILIGGPTYCTVQSRQNITDMVAHGANPIDVSCLWGGTSDTLCASRAAHRD